MPSEIVGLQAFHRCPDRIGLAALPAWSTCQSWGRNTPLCCSRILSRERAYRWGCTDRRTQRSCHQWLQDRIFLLRFYNSKWGTLFLELDFTLACFSYLLKCGSLCTLGSHPSPPWSATSWSLSWGCRRLNRTGVGTRRSRRRWTCCPQSRTQSGHREGEGSGIKNSLLVIHRDIITMNP